MVGVHVQRLNQRGGIRLQLVALLLDLVGEICTVLESVEIKLLLVGGGVDLAAVHLDELHPDAGLFVAQLLIDRVPDVVERIRIDADLHNGRLAFLAGVHLVRHDGADDYREHGNHHDDNRYDPRFN